MISNLKKNRQKHNTNIDKETVLWMTLDNIIYKQYTDIYTFQSMSASEFRNRIISTGFHIIGTNKTRMFHLSQKTSVAWTQYIMAP